MSIESLLSARFRLRRLRYEVPKLEENGEQAAWYFPPFSADDHIEWSERLYGGDLKACAEYIALRCENETGGRVFGDNDAALITRLLEAAVIADIAVEIVGNVVTVEEASGNSQPSAD